MIFDKDSGHQVHTDKSKLHLLNKKLRADFLATMKMTIDIQMSATPMTMAYSFALENYRNAVNQRFPNESTVKRNNIRIQTTYSHGGRGGRGGRGHQGRYGRGGHGGRGGGKVRKKYYWEVTELNGRTIKVHPYYMFEIYQWFNIPEYTWMKLTHIGRYYQSQNRQRTDAGRGTNSQFQQQRQVQQTYSYCQPVPETIIRLPPQPHGSISPPPTPR